MEGWRLGWVGGGGWEVELEVEVEVEKRSAEGRVEWIKFKLTLVYLEGGGL